ncbi:MAG: hypothetical protein ACIAQZ_02355 [Sedimentisphaeraceae bacterium JB056]
METIPLTYNGIEEILGNKLAKSAYIHRPWWSNSGQVHSPAWTDAGWKVSKIEMGQWVEFTTTK